MAGATEMDGRDEEKFLVVLRFVFTPLGPALYTQRFALLIPIAVRRGASPIGNPKPGRPPPNETKQKTREKNARATLKSATRRRTESAVLGCACVRGRCYTRRFRARAALKEKSYYRAPTHLVIRPNNHRIENRIPSP